MSMFALCAEIVSCTRTGRASALISWSRPLPFGYWTTSTAVIFPPARVSRTSTGPQRVWATAPVTVEDPATGVAVVAADPPVGAATTVWLVVAGPDVEVW